MSPQMAFAEFLDTLRGAASRGTRRVHEQLQALVGPEPGAWRFSMRREDMPANAAVFDALDGTAPLRAGLEGKTIIEFPTILVQQGHAPSASSGK